MKVNIKQELETITDISWKYDNRDVLIVKAHSAADANSVAEEFLQDISNEDKQSNYIINNLYEIDQDDYTYEYRVKCYDKETV